MAAVLTAGVMFTSCKEDTQPRLEQPTEFKLNTPPMANEIIILSPDGPGSIVEFTVSQPDYGMGVVTSYEVQLSKTADFAEFESLPTIGTNARIQALGEEMAVAVNALDGIRTEEDQDKFTDQPRDIFVRIRAFVPNCDYSSIFSNAVSICVKPYYAIRVPAKIYVIGDFQGWDINASNCVVDESENGIGSNIYTGVFDVPAGKAMFRFYTQLGDWETNSIGYQVDDKATDFDWPGDDKPVFESKAVDGKGAWNFPSWPGGEMKITFDLNTYTLYIEKN